MNSDPYLLARGFLESTRLNLQHYAFREALGYSVYGNIDTQSHPLKIADLGTGTGIWLFELSESLPESTQLHGFDISDEQYPPACSRPNNVQLFVSDVQQGPPEHLQNTYDLVHVRLFLGVVKMDDPSKIIDHAMKLLKPGGFLQWSEYDTLAQISVGHDGVPSEALREICMSPNRVAPKTWVEKLPQTLQNHGLELITVERKRERIWQRHQLMENICILAKLIASERLRENTPPRERWIHVQETSRKAYEEAKKGACFSQLFQCVVSKKPSVLKE